MGEGTGLFDGHQSIAPDDHPPWSALVGAILDDEALEARRHDLHSEAPELAVPQETLPNLDPNLRRFGSLQDVDNPLCELFSSHISHLLEFCLEHGYHTPHLRKFQAFGSKSPGRLGIQTADRKPTTTLIYSMFSRYSEPQDALA